MKKHNWDNIEEAKEYEKPTPGGYICGITNVIDDEQKEYLKLEYDFAEGKFKNYWRDLYNAKGFWGGSFLRSYKEKALPYFKGFKTAVEQSNSGYKFDEDNLAALKRKLVGLVLGEEEYQANDGSIKTRLYVAQILSAAKIKSGNFKVPPLKKLADNTNQQTSSTSSANSNFTPIADDDLPF